ncbi:hypothetical protein [Actinoplanes sp. HUAS TT8]|uniref:hypothetical protein n=1 Tax=Actinoplanes sp. HUAS TT8 TaxID=3447453 RepID=UPI003F52668E
MRFSFGGPVDYPYAPAKVSAEQPPALFRRMQAVSPPPSRRDGTPWQAGMTLDGKPFDPAGPRNRLAEVEHAEDVDGLGAPEPETVVLDWMFDVPRERQTVAMPGEDAGRFLLSVPYWQPASDSGKTVSKTVEYFGTHRVEWAQRPRSEWVAVSFDGFWPAERDSADMIIPLGDCDDRCPAS